MSLKKPYSQWTAEEKAAYKAKKVAYIAKRKDNYADAHQQLVNELKKLNAPQSVMDLLAKLAPGARGQTTERETYLTAIFGTETPVENTVVSYLYIGIRGPAGERLNPGETIGQFVTRTGDCNYKYDANTIYSMVWYLKKRGFEVINDREKATVTFVRRAADAVAPAVAENLPAVKPTKVKKDKAA